MFSTCLEGVRRIEQKIGKNSGIFPRQPKKNTRREESLVNEFQDMLPTNEKRSIAETMKRCDHCSRGGINSCFVRAVLMTRRLQVQIIVSIRVFKNGSALLIVLTQYIPNLLPRFKRMSEGSL